MHCGWRWDGERLSATSDRSGFFPLFYSEERGHVRISSSLEALIAAGAGTDFDEGALAVFLRLGFYLGEDTPFRRIRVLPPGGTLHWISGELIVEGGYPAARPADISWEGAVEGYIDLFDQAMGRLLPDDLPIVLPLSGGKDSRHILLALQERGRAPRLCVTFKHLPWRTGDDHDLALAQRLCQALALPHVALTQPRDLVRLEKEKNRLTHLLSDEHTQYLTLRDFLEPSSALVFDGIAGDVLSESMFRNPEWTALLRRGSFLEVAEQLLGPEGYLPRVLREDAYRRFSRERALHRLASELARHAGTPNPVSSFLFWNRTRREIALSPFAILRGSRVMAPFLDHDLFDFLSSLPAELLEQGRLHTTVIRRAYPAFAHIPLGHEMAQTGQTAGTFARTRAYDVQLALGSLHDLRRSDAGDIIDQRYAIARSLAALGSKSQEVIPWLPRRILYLSQLIRLARRRRLA